MSRPPPRKGPRPPVRNRWPQDQLGKHTPPLDRLPTRHELLNVIVDQARTIRLLTDHRNKLAADLAEIVCPRGVDL